MVIRILNEGPRLFYGDATHLVAWHVHDLQIKRSTSGKILMQWTAPAGSYFESTAERFVPLGNPKRWRYEWSDRDERSTRRQDPPITDR
jgi:hypothetical protein